MCCSTPSLFFFLFQIVTSMMSLVTASTISYPMSTILVFSSTLELLTFTTLACAAVSPHLHLATTGIILSIILSCRSFAWLACS